MSFTAAAQSDIKLYDLRFISGRWKGSASWGDMEENWSSPQGNCMVGSYRCVKDGQVVFYEFIVIEQNQDEAPVMKLRHFSAGNVAWEEKDKPVDFVIASISTDIVRFETKDKKSALSFERLDREKMKVTLEREEKDGKKSTDVFNYTLAK